MTSEEPNSSFVRKRAFVTIVFFFFCNLLHLIYGFLIFTQEMLSLDLALNLGGW